MAVYGAAMAYAPSGHIEQLPSGSWRAKVYAGKDPLSGREIRFRKTRRTEVEAQIELGKLLELARSSRNVPMICIELQMLSHPGEPSRGGYSGPGERWEPTKLASDV